VVRGQVESRAEREAVEEDAVGDAVEDAVEDAGESEVVVMVERMVEIGMVSSFSAGYNRFDLRSKQTTLGLPALALFDPEETSNLGIDFDKSCTYSLLDSTQKVVSCSLLTTNLISTSWHLRFV
jgi:hypothetical protein